MRPTVRSRRIGTRLGSFRRQSRMSGTELASRIGIHQATWSKIESGKVRVSANVLARAADVLNIPADAWRNSRICVGEPTSRVGGRTTGTSCPRLCRC